MSHPRLEPITPTRSLAARMKALRRRHGWSAADLAERMAAAGFKWDRFTVQNLESGRRQVVSLDEAVALARVFQVAFVNAVLSIDDDAGETRVEMAAGDYASPNAVREWMCGKRPLGADPRVYNSEVPIMETHHGEAIRHGGTIAMDLEADDGR